MGSDRRHQLRNLRIKLRFFPKHIVVDVKSFPEKPSVASVTQITLFTIGKLPRISLMRFICVKFVRKK